MHSDTWQTQEAKAHFSAVLRAAQIRPQRITYRGERAAVLISEEEYAAVEKKKKKRRQQKKYRTLGEFLDASPLKGADLAKLIKRDKSLARRIDL